jgi:uncharacterized protein (TIGR00369 family)
MADGGDESSDEWRVAITEGEWAGWSAWRPAFDPFEALTGPFYFRIEADGSVRCAMRAQAQHMNAGGAVHGGLLLTFADYALFAIAQDALAGPAVTVSLNGDFMGPATLGDLLEATGEVVRAGGSLVFVRGLISTGGAPVMTFSGVIKKIRPR